MLNQIQQSIVDLRAQNLPYSRIAERLNVPEHVLHHNVNKLRAMGVDLRSKHRAESDAWPAEKIEKLKARWTDGANASAIARTLGVSRSAVLGKVHRLGLPGRGVPRRGASSSSAPKPTMLKPPAAPPRPWVKSDDHDAMERGEALLESKLLKAGMPDRRRQDALPVAEPVAPAEPERTEPVTLLMLSRRTCRWPIGDPRHPDFHFCGRMPAKTGPYCPYHHALSRASSRHGEPAA